MRSRNYKTWNRHRNNKDADRIIIEKGSVLVVQLKESISSEFFEKGIGSHKNEGFGDVIINPDFLAGETSKLPYSLNKVEQQYEEHFAVKNEAKAKDMYMLDCLQAREEGNSFDAKIDKLVNEFKQKFEKDFDGITKSQCEQSGILEKMQTAIRSLRSSFSFNQTLVFCIVDSQSQIGERKTGEVSLKLL